jgi:hypothetical protein
MSDIVTNLSLDGILRALSDLGIDGKISIVDGTEMSCVTATHSGIEFLIYTSPGTVCLQSSLVISRSSRVDHANFWNARKKWARVIAVANGYLVRFEADISHGFTRENLRWIIVSFIFSAKEFSELIISDAPNFFEEVSAIREQFLHEVRAYL